MPKWLQVLFIIALSLSSFLLISLAAGGAQTPAFESFIAPMLGVSALTIVILSVYILSSIYRLINRLRDRAFGSKMTAYLAGTIALCSIVPCLVIYLISHQFIGRSVDSWFDVRIERALDAGVTLSSEVLDGEQQKLLASAKRIASILAMIPIQEREIALDRMRASNEVAVIYSATGEILASSFSSISPISITDRPTGEQFLKAAQDNGINMLVGERDDGSLSDKLQIRALVPLDGRISLRPTTFLQLSQPVAQSISDRASELVQGYRNYQELVLSRAGLRDVYRMALTMMVILAGLGSIAIAFGFAKNMTAPLLQLAKGTRKVAEGDLEPIKSFAGKSELNVLTQSFNAMVLQLAEARETVERQRLAAEQAHAQLERILATLSSGVLVVDDKFQVVMSNEATHLILDTPAIASGTNLSEVSEPLSSAIYQESLVTPDENDIRLEFTIKQAEGSTEEKIISLLVHASRLEIDPSINWWVIVIDDITAVLDGQRALAWGEVARRLAHEIKNPLTPIRLAAERLEMKLSPVLDEHHANILQRSTQTIVMQVDAMKKMVNDFRDLAKLPKAQLAPLDLHRFLEEVMALYHSADVPVTYECLAHNALILGDQNQLRQVIHNLISNALDATQDESNPSIQMRVEASQGELESVPTAYILTITDNGPGFPEKFLSRIFEPYVTTKANGTGLGLSMVKKILDEHNARVMVCNRMNDNGEILGAQIQIIFPASTTLGLHRIHIDHHA